MFYAAMMAMCALFYRLLMPETWRFDMKKTVFLH